jgi:dihydroxyacid dehydratase/phosphogluconate dehydratase
VRTRPTFDKARLPSRHVTEGIFAAPQRAFYYAMGLEAEDIHRPLVGVATAWDGASGAADVPFAVAEAVEAGVSMGGATPRKFATVADDAGAGGESGRLLISRELVADSVELTVRGHSYDAIVGIGSSSLGIAGLIMGACRLDIPAVIVPVVSDALGSEGDAFAMARAAEALGLTPPGTDASPASARAAGTRLAELIGAARSARSIVTAEGLRAAAADPSVAIHLAAIASECGIDLDLSDFGTWVSGSLAPEGALVEGFASAVRGRAAVFDDEASACAWLERDPALGTIVVVRFQGPAGAPGMRRLDDLARLVKPGAVVVTDGRMPRVDGVVTVSAVGPEAAAGGPLSQLRDGDAVALDGTLDVTTSFDGRTPAAPPARALPRTWSKYSKTVGPARGGAVTHPGARGERMRYVDL